MKLSLDHSMSVFFVETDETTNHEAIVEAIEANAIHSDENTAGVYTGEFEYLPVFLSFFDGADFTINVL